MIHQLSTRILAIARHRKILSYAAIVLAVIIAGCATWTFVAGGSSGYQEQTITSIFGQQTIRTKGNSAQLCSNGKWIPIEINGGNIKIPGGTTIAVGGAPCANSGAGKPLVAVLILIIAAVLEVVTLGFLFLVKPEAGKPEATPVGSAT
jgi:hypothetical protein